MPGSILDRMISTFSGVTDNFERTAVPPLPISFDRINEATTIRSILPLFKLPTELLHYITPYLSKSDLAALAFIDRDCRQLARSIQFSSLHIDYSDNSISILMHLIKESTQGPRIGPCVRRITFSTNPAWIHMRHGIALNDEFMALEEDLRNRLLEQASEIHDDYVQLFAHTISHSLPNLELLDWQDRTLLTPSIMSCVASSPIKHLKFSGVQVEEEFEVSMPEGPQKWELESLDIEFNWSLTTDAVGSASPLIYSIIRQAAPFLRRLIWHETITLSRLRSNIRYPFAANTLHFPNLRQLSLFENDSSDEGILSAFLAPMSRAPIETLATSSAGGFLAKQGYVSTLEQFHWTNFKDGVADERGSAIDFIRANSQLKAFTVVYGLSPEYIDQTLLPAFVHGNFHFLRTLYLVWDSDVISSSSLRTLSQIQTLSQLRISAGEQFGWRHNWKIDHKLLMEVLSPLINLRDLAFSRDTYVCNVPGSKVESYYEDHIFPLDEDVLDYIERDDPHEDPLSMLNDVGQEWVFRHTEAAWEKRHRMMIESLGSEYAKIFTQLEFCYFGQLPMNIEGEGNERKAVAQSEARDDCWSFLRRRWGILH